MASGKVQLWEGKVLLVGGKVALHEDCCCCPCNACGENAVGEDYAQDAMAVSLEIGGDDDAMCACVPATLAWGSFLDEQVDDNGDNWCRWWWSAINPDACGGQDPGQAWHVWLAYYKDGPSAEKWFAILFSGVTAHAYGGDYLTDFNLPSNWTEVTEEASCSGRKIGLTAVELPGKDNAGDDCDASTATINT